MGSSPSASDLSKPGLTESNTRHTSADEATLREHMPEEPRDPPQSLKASAMSQGFTEAQLAELCAMMSEFATTELVEKEIKDLPANGDCYRKSSIQHRGRWLF